MMTRTLGRCGFDVAEISLGAWQIGGTSYGPVADTEAEAIIKTYLDAGGNFIDTARRYGNSEERLGAFFRRNGGRDRVIIASKSPVADPDTLTAEVETSLRNLKTDFIDLYYLHSPPEDPNAAAALLDRFEALKKTGKIRAVGASIKGPDVTDATVALCRHYIDSGIVDVIMLIYSIFRQKNKAVLEIAAANDVGIVARTVLESGFLSGRYKPGVPFLKENDHRQRWGEKRLAAILRETESIAGWCIPEGYASLADTALKFVLDTEGVSNVVVGARTADQIARSMAAAQLPLLPLDIRERLVRTFRDRDAEFNTGE